MTQRLFGMATSCVWKYWDRLERPTRMVCKLCSATLSTHNCGNAKKHLRHKHGGEFIEVQMMDQQLRANVKHRIKKSVPTVKKPIEQKSLTIDEITALFLPNLDQAETSTNLDETRSEKSNLVESGLDAEVKILRKAIKIRSIELVLDVEGSDDPVRLSFPFQSNNNNATILNVLNSL